MYMKTKTDNHPLLNTRSNCLITVFLLIIGLNGCIDPPIIGNGEIGEETRVLPAFSEIVSNGSYDVFFEYGESYEARIVCESNLLPYVETSVFDGPLDIRTPHHVSISNYLPIEIYVKSPSIDKINLAGSGSIETCTLTEPSLSLIISGSGEIRSSFRGSTLGININGSGDMLIDAECETLAFMNDASGDLTLRGSCQQATYSLSGSGNVDAFDFPCKEANASLSGSGDLSIRVSDYLNVSISGSGDLYYFGTPSINQVITGSGNLINKN